MRTCAATKFSHPGPLAELAGDPPTYLLPPAAHAHRASPLAQRRRLTVQRSSWARSGSCSGHPAIAVALERAYDGEPRWRATRRRRAQAALRALGVEAICTAPRRPLERSAGALQPPQVVPVP